MPNLMLKDKSSLKPFIIVSITLLLIVILTLTVKSYFSKVIASNWDNISIEKSDKIKDDCLNLFYNYQNQASAFSSELLKNKKLVNSLSVQNARKSYEYLQETENLNNYNVEIYNSRLELFLYMGRQLNPDVTELKRAINGEKFSAVKEIGFYSYIVVYEPITIDSLTSANKTVSNNWVLVTAKLLDIKYEIQNRFFNDIGITREISRRFQTDVTFDFSHYSSPGAIVDSSSFRDKFQYDLKNIKQEVIGKLFLPKLEKSSYIINVESKFSTAIASEVFILNVFLAAIAIIFIRRIKPLFLNLAAFTALFVLSRYLWILVDFPAKIFSSMNYEIFSPVFYASSFGFGIGKSIGDILISSIILLVILIYAARLAIIFFKREIDKSNLLVNISFVIVCTGLSILSLIFYGAIIQSIIYDSTLKFIDHSQLLNTQQPELIYANLCLVILSVSLLIIISLTGLVITKVLQPFLLKNTIFRRNSVFLVFGLLIILNLVIELFTPWFGELYIKLNFRILIYGLSSVFTYFVYRQLLVVKNYRFVNLLNLSLLLLACVIFVPALLLNKITSQENRYMERFARNISEQSDDKINFLITTSLDDAAENPDLEIDLKNKNKFPRIAFNIWTKSKFINEDINSAVFVLDTAKRLISDFNFNPAELVPDSVIRFALRSTEPVKKIKPEKIVQLPDTSMSSDDDDIGFTSDSRDPSDYDEVLQNKEMKFFCGIRPIEKTDLKNSKFNKILGYIIIAAQYDAKNFVAQTGGGLFRNFSMDNITNKLTSQPVLSEFSDGELVGSSNKEISKAFLKSIDAFRESVKDKKDKSALRYDEFENELYKSFYYMNSSQGASSPEKVYVVSVKVNDLGLYSFYILRYLLFLFLVFLVLLCIYVIYKIAEYASRAESTFKFKFRFREKLFVSFVLASVLPIIVLAVYTRELAKEKNNDFYKNQIISDLRIIEQYIRTKAPFLDVPVPKPGKEGKQENLSELFGKGFSESDKNFNLFVKTKLAATTNEQLYKSDLLDTRISGNAFFNIALLKKDYYSESQEIGNYKFIVGYKPMYDRFNNLAGIISTQTVFKQSDINSELTETLVYIFGPYIIAVILLIAIVNLISYRISNPIVKLQKATEQLSRGNIDIQVKSSSSDEIGELISSFNKMTRELKRSRTELKKAERETAWRDIARQIAHEIKNPLTPMKLAMQHLYYAYTHGANDFKSIIQTTNRLIIEQIESLNRIATEFSDFAKMPSRNYEPLNVEQILQDVVELLNRDGKIALTLKNNLGSSRVTGDKDEVKRAFINIIRNSKQAIDENNLNRSDGIVNVTALKSNGFYSVKVADNGIGMDDITLQKLFEPYFSTKSSGMGLGLVITKKILDDMHAIINVKSEVNKGTEVEVKFIIEK